MNKTYSQNNVEQNHGKNNYFASAFISMALNMKKNEQYTLESNIIVINGGVQ